MDRLEKLKEELSEIATIEVCKKGTVFTLLMTGSGLSNSLKHSKIQMTVLQYVGDGYPIIECMRNSDAYFLIVLKPRIS